MLVEDLSQEVEELLSPPYRESRDDDIAACALGFLQNRSQLVLRFSVAYVESIPVSGLHDEVVRLLDDLRVADDRLVGLAHVAAEEHLDLLALLLEPQFQEGRTQDMPGIVKDNGHAGGQLRGLGIVQRLEQPDRFASIVLIIQRLDAVLPRPSGLARTPLRFHLLDVGGVEQHDLSQVARGRSGVDRPGVSLLDQAGDPAGVIDMSVREQHEIQLQGIEREGGEVLCLLLVSSLVHAAVDQKASNPDLHHVTRSRDLARCSADL